MLPVELISKHGSLEILAMIDEGSTVSLISDVVVNKLRLNRKKIDVKLQGINGENAIITANDTVDFYLISDEFSYKLTNVVVVKNLPLPFQKLDVCTTELCFKEFNINLRLYSGKPELLIGQDHGRVICTRDIKISRQNHYILSRCLMGWTIHGAIGTRPTNYIHFLTKNKRPLISNSNSNDEDLHTLVRSYFELDSINVPNNTTLDPLHQRALDIFESTCKFINGRWEIGLPFKHDDESYPDNRNNAVQRLRMTHMKFARDPVYERLYRSEMDRLFSNGFAVVAGKRTGDKICYLPHFGVCNINKPNRIRLVFDCAAKTYGTSFNDLILPGPDLLQPLNNILMQFRQYHVACKADMKDMFLKTKIRDEDNDTQRFLWNDPQSNDIVECKMISMLFGATSSPSAAIFVKNKNARLFIDRFPSAVKIIEENFYMDDLLHSFQNVEDASQAIQQITDINKHATWEMHGWASNRPEIFKDFLINENKNITFTSDSNEKILGLVWMNQIDVLGFNLNLSKFPDHLMNGSVVPTKREFLRIMMSVFDPLGFLTPFTIQSKILLQKIWKSGIGWDDKLSENEIEAWHLWLNSLSGVNKCTIPRCYQLGMAQSACAELHVFCDASELAYTAVAYWRFHLSNNKFHVAFITSKNRVAPNKPMTIPRLELQAALLGAKLARFVQDAHTLTVTKRQLWSDSRTVCVG